MGYAKVFHNAKWIVLCKLAQSLLQLVVGMLSARYLGPSNYGLINYASSIVAFALPLMKLGLDATMVHELVESPQREKEVVGTSLFMNLLSSLACMGGVIAFSSVVNRGDPVTIVVCALYSTSIFFAAAEMIQYWFQYKLLSKYSSVVLLGVYVVVSAYKVFLLATGKGVYWFALSHSLEYALVALCLTVIYVKKGGRFAVSFSLAKEMLKRSKHYVLASLMVIVIHNTDHIMLTLMVGQKENGYYSAAITSATVLQFVGTAIIDSFRPVILANKKENVEEYQKSISRLYAITFYFYILQSLAFTLFAPLILTVLYGNDFTASVPVLRILVWYLAFAVMGTVRNVWILAEQKQKYLWVVNMTAALLNVVLNGVMIPVWGAGGAAFASLITQIFANFVLGFLIKPLRENNRLLLIGLNPRFVVTEVKGLLQSLKKQT